MPIPKWTDNRWRIQVMRNGERFSFSSTTPGAKGRRECQRKYDQWFYGEASGEKTVGRVAEEYLEDLIARRGKDSGAYFQNEAYIRLYITPRCASKKICKMTLRDWQRVINEARSISGRELSHKTLVNLRGIIMAIIKFGYEDYQCELLRGNLYIPSGHARAEKEILQKSDVARLFEPSDEWYHPLFCFLVITGMRPGEALGLQIDDIGKDCVRITRAVNSRGIITSGKNDNARRMIPIGKLARQILDNTIARNEDYKLHTKWIFCDYHGAPGNQSTMRNQWRKLKQERSLPGTVYSLRHTFISLMKNTLPEQTIKDIVGHSVSMDTFGVYGHLIDGESARAAEVIDLTFQNNFTEISPSKN